MSKRRNPDEKKKLPVICKKCPYRAAADPQAAAEVQAMMKHTENAMRITWQVAARAFDDFHNLQCPIVMEPDGLDWCQWRQCKDIGDEAHPNWKCWMRWLTTELEAGRYSGESIEARKKQLGVRFVKKAREGWPFKVGLWLVKWGAKLMWIREEDKKED